MAETDASLIAALARAGLHPDAATLARLRPAAAQLAAMLRQSLVPAAAEPAPRFVAESPA